MTISLNPQKTGIVSAENSQKKGVNNDNGESKQVRPQQHHDASEGKPLSQSTGDNVSLSTPVKKAVGPENITQAEAPLTAAAGTATALNHEEAQEVLQQTLKALLNKPKEAVSAQANPTNDAALRLLDNS